MQKFLLMTADWSQKSRELRILMLQLKFEFEEITLSRDLKLHTSMAIRNYPTLIKLEDGVEVARKVAPDLSELILFVQGEQQ